MGLLDGTQGAHLRGRERPLHRMGHRPGAPRAGRDGRLQLGRDAHREARQAARRRASARLRGAVRRPGATRTSSASSRPGRSATARLDILVHARRVRASERSSRASSWTRRATASRSRSTSPPTRSSRSHAPRQPLMADGGSILTLTYYGAEKVVANYNVMGVAKAALEAMRALPRRGPGSRGHPGQRHQRRAGPDARGVGGQRTSRSIHRQFRDVTPDAHDHHHRGRRRHRRCISCSDLSRAVTGEVVYVDGGYNVIGVPRRGARVNVEG